MSAGRSGQAGEVIGGIGGLDEEGPEGSISFGFRGGGGQGAAAAGGQTDSASDAAGVCVESEFAGEPSLGSPAAGANGTAAARAGAAGPGPRTAAVASHPAPQGGRGQGTGPEAQPNVNGAGAGGRNAGGGGGAGGAGSGAAGRQQMKRRSGAGDAAPQKMRRTTDAADTGATGRAQLATEDDGDAGPGPSAGRAVFMGPLVCPRMAPGPVSAEPRPLVVPIGSLAKLQAWLVQLATLAQQQQQQQSGSGAVASGGGGDIGGGAQAVHHVLDLCGQQLGGGEGQMLVVPPGVKATIRNGTLLLCVLVREGANVQFQDVRFAGQPGMLGEGEHGWTLPGDGTVPAVVTVHGLNAGAQLVWCTVEAQGESRCTFACVMARGGGHVQMHYGTLTGAASGLVVDSGSSGVATRTVAEGCAWVGFSASGPGADLKLRGCTARGNGGDGMGSYSGGRTEVAALRWDEPCGAWGNQGCGMHAKGAGSVLVAGEDTEALRNGRVGIGASEGGQVTAGNGVVAAWNKLDGFCAWDGGKLTAGSGARSSSNGRDGFACYGGESRLDFGGYAAASGNVESGFRCCDGGRTTVDGRAVAERNKFGFFAEASSTITLGARCVALENRESGYVAQGSSELAIGGGGRAEGNGKEGVVAEGARVVIQAGGFTAVGNGSEGIVVASGGHLDAEAGGLVSRGNDGDGVCCEGEGSVACIGGTGSMVVGNMGSGCMAKEGGVLRLGPGGGVVRANASYGLHVDGKSAEGAGSRIRVVEGWEVSRNAAGDRKETRGAQIVEGSNGLPLLKASGGLGPPY